MDQTSWSPAVQSKVASYFRGRSIDPALVTRVDYVLALLSINTRETIQLAEEIIGKAITRCPTVQPPDPRKSTIAARQPVVTMVVRNPCLPTTPAFQRFKEVKIGRTREQLISRGVTARDLSVWKKAGYYEIS